MSEAGPLDRQLPFFSLGVAAAKALEPVSLRPEIAAEARKIAERDA